MKLLNSLICLDVESTGVWVEKDKIIEVAFIKVTPDGKKETFYHRLNPGITIPELVTKLTGISDDDVKSCPTFKDIALELRDFLEGSDIAGFSVERFDLPLLEREFADAGIKFDWKTRKIYDAQKIFHVNEKRDLSAAYKFYCNQDLVGAHSALVDTEAVLCILEEQVKKYGEGQDELSVLDKFEYPSNSLYYDAEKKFCWWNGQLYLMFGKYARKQPLEEIVKIDAGYLKWVMTSDFSENVKKIIAQALKGEIPKQAVDSIK